MLTFLLGFLLSAAVFEGLCLWQMRRGGEKEQAADTAESLVDQGFENIMRFTVGGEKDA